MYIYSMIDDLLIRLKGSGWYTCMYRCVYDCMFIILCVCYIIYNSSKLYVCMYVYLYILQCIL